MAVSNFSPEHRAKIAATLKGQKKTPEHRAKIAAGAAAAWKTRNRPLKVGDSKARVPVAPLLDLIENRVRRLKPSQEMGIHAHQRDNHGVDVWASVGIGYQRYRRLLKEDTISVYRADKAAMALGMHPTEIWPDFDRIDGMAA